MNSATTSSVSLDAVPLPITMVLMLYFLDSLSRTAMVPLTSFFGSVGYTVVYALSLPVSSSTATLHPVLKPGSILIMRAPLTGGTISSFSVFFANTLTASSSALSVSEFLKSRSAEGAISLLYASAIVSLSILQNTDFSLEITWSAIIFSILSTSVLTFTFSFFSFSPLFMARILWLGIFDAPSQKS